MIVRHVHEHLRGGVTRFHAGEVPPDAIRLDLNEGPYGPTPSALAAIARHAPLLNRYPDPDGTMLRLPLAERLSVDPDCLLFGAGSNPLGSLLIRCAAGPGRRVVYSWPGFPTYGFAALRIDATPVAVPVREDGSDDLEALAAAARDAAVVVLATPANPTGRYVAEGLEAFVAEASRHALVIVDEAYHEYAPSRTTGLDLFKAGHEVVVLRTFSKAWGLAGLRVGYAIADPDLVAIARSVQDTFEVSTLAYAAASAALADVDEVERRVRENAAIRERLEETLDEMGAPCYESAANFVCARPADPHGFTARLLAQGIVVRVVDAFGDPTRVRVGVPADADAARVLAAVRAALRR